MAYYLSKRDKGILTVLINEYISTGEPVSSRTLAKKSGLRLSAATIRNVMSDLEESNFLEQPHISAGRMPTDQGFRFYVNQLLELGELRSKEKNNIDKNYCRVPLEFDELMHETCRVLSFISKYTGIVINPIYHHTIFRHLEFIKLNQKKILIIFVNNRGTILKGTIRVNEKVNQAQLIKYAHYLSNILMDLNISQARKVILKEMEGKDTRHDKLFSKILKLSLKVMDKDPGTGSIYIDGKWNIFNQMNFTDIEEMVILLKAFEEKNILVKIMDKALSTEGVQVFIGGENKIKEIQNCSLVASSYGKSDDICGTLGVIGPKRMNYSKVIPTVGYLAKRLSNYLKLM